MVSNYPVQFDVDFPARPLGRLTTAFRLIVAIPIVVLLTMLTGETFRNDDNTANRKSSELMTPGLGEKREFQFVLTAGDEAKSCADLEQMEHIYHEKDRKRIAATNRFGAYAGGNGSVTITGMTLGHLKPDVQAWIESMRFEATFSFRAADEKHEH